MLGPLQMGIPDRQCKGHLGDLVNVDPRDHDIRFAIMRYCS